jgi:glycosyltransferase involved in cell wall biosynthesis
MKKKILFVIPSMSAGGGEKSLVNLLSQIDYNLYDVDIFVFSKTGVFFNSIPKEVNVLDTPSDYTIFTKKLGKSIKDFMKNRKFNLAYNRFMFSVKNRLIKNVSIAEQYSWKYQSNSFNILEKDYDVAIGFLEKSSIYFVVDKVKSKKKIGWIHTNYSNSGMDNNFDNPYFEQLGNIVTVSEECAKSLNDQFLHLNTKVKVIYNIVSPKMIIELSERKILLDDFIQDKNYTNIITVARLSEEKGVDLAIRSCKLLIDKGYKIRWNVLGEGNERAKLESLIKSNGLENNFILLGVKENPYPYIRNADIYVQPSKYEGKSIALDEAKILLKPIVVTNYKTVNDQISDGMNGLIVDMNEDGISNGVETLIKHIDIKNKLINNLNLEKLGTEEEIKKLYQIF